MEVEKLQINASYHWRPKTYMETAREQRRPRMKIAKHKGPSTNDVMGKDGKENEGGIK